MPELFHTDLTGLKQADQTLHPTGAFPAPSLELFLC
jgi:hypothetical protein